MQQKVLVFDVDGTLYDMVHHEIPSSAIAAIKKAKENGHIFVIASGRAFYGLGKALDELAADYIISMSGGVLTNNKKQIIKKHVLAKEDIQDLVDFANAHEAGLVLKFKDGMYLYQHSEKINWLEGQMNSDIGQEIFVDCPLQNHHLKDEEVLAACIHADPKIIKAAFSQHPRMSFTSYCEDGFDVAVKGCTKGSALSELMQHLNVKREDVICFGDNYNDISMMETAGYSIAMGNAVAEIKERADYVTSSTDQDGIYKGLLHIGCIND